jgi:hypothetical protein
VSEGRIVNEISAKSHGTCIYGARTNAMVMVETERVCTCHVGLEASGKCRNRRDGWRIYARLAERARMIW